MPAHPRLPEWIARIEELCALIVRRPELAWLWEIRVKILMYLVSRYGEADLPPVAAPPPPDSRSSFIARPKLARRRATCTASRRTQFRTLLERIHRVNRASKASTAR